MPTTPSSSLSSPNKSPAHCPAFVVILTVCFNVIFCDIHFLNLISQFALVWFALIRFRYLSQINHAPSNVKLKSFHTFTFRQTMCNYFRFNWNPPEVWCSSNRCKLCEWITCLFFFSVAQNALLQRPQVGFGCSHSFRSIVSCLYARLLDSSQTLTFRFRTIQVWLLVYNGRIIR